MVIKTVWITVEQQSQNKKENVGKCLKNVSVVFWRENSNFYVISCCNLIFCTFKLASQFFAHWDFFRPFLNTLQNKILSFQGWTFFFFLKTDPVVTIAPIFQVQQSRLLMNDYNDLSQDTRRKIAVENWILGTHKSQCLFFK